MSPFLRPRPVTAPAVRLVVIPHSGGSGSTFFPLSQGVPDDWDVLLIDLPGRGKRRRTAPITDMSSLVAVVSDDVIGWAERPLALFGHSLGAVVAVEVARSLEIAGLRPVWVGVSGRVAPATSCIGRTLHTLPDDELLRELALMGGLPDRINDLPEFRREVLRVVRADLRAVESYRPTQNRRPLHAPLTSFAATNDPWAPLWAYPDWARETRARYHQRTLPGGHFYFARDRFANLTAAIVAEIRYALRPGPLVHTPRAESAAS